MREFWIFLSLLYIIPLLYVLIEVVLFHGTQDQYARLPSSVKGPDNLCKRASTEAVNWQTR